MRTPIRILIGGRQVLSAHVELDRDSVLADIRAYLPALRRSGPVVVLADRGNVTTILMRA